MSDTYITGKTVLLEKLPVAYPLKEVFLPFFEIEMFITEFIQGSHRSLSRVILLQLTEISFLVLSKNSQKRLLA
jgi:hypothetical protein